MVGTEAVEESVVVIEKLTEVEEELKRRVIGQGTAGARSPLAPAEPAVADGRDHRAAVVRHEREQRAWQHARLREAGGGWGAGGRGEGASMAVPTVVRGIGRR